METKQSKQEYFKKLREDWKQAKALIENPEYKEKFALLLKESPDMRISATGFAFCLASMKANNFDGLPYMDCKTFKGWKDSGFIVKKGEHSKVDGLTWIVSTKENDQGEEETSGMYPKAYKLFHSTQVEAL